MLLYNRACVLLGRITKVPIATAVVVVIPDTGQGGNNIDWRKETRDCRPVLCKKRKKSDALSVKLFCGLERKANRGTKR